ncbi:hypothetical protein GCM10009722_10740 [Williamsia deligens]
MYEMWNVPVHRDRDEERGAHGTDTADGEGDQTVSSDGRETAARRGPVSATAAGGESTEIDRPAAGEQVLTTRLHGPRVTKLTGPQRGRAVVYMVATCTFCAIRNRPGSQV